MVDFVNVPDIIWVDLANPVKIILQYSVAPEVRLSCKDWVGIFPVTCNLTKKPIPLNLLVSFEYQIHESNPRKGFKMCMTDICLEGAETLDALNFAQEYQFVYIDEDCNVQGVSHVFKFGKLENSLEPSSTFLSESNKDRNEEETFQESGAANLDFHKSDFFRSLKMNHEVERVDSYSDGRCKPTFPKDYTDGNYARNQQLRTYDKNRNKQGYKNKHQQWRNHSQGREMQPPHPPSVPSACSNCHRVATLLNTQNKLYSQVKYLAEKNSDLEEELRDMRQQLELCQAANQKLSVLLAHERNLRLYYPGAMINHHNQAAMVDSAPPSPHPRASREDKTRPNNVLKMKAFIGTQEQKIQSLTEQLAKLQVQIEEFNKVKQAIKSLDELMQNEPNNNDVQDIVGENATD